MNVLRTAPQLCQACLTGATACQDFEHLSCADRRRIWGQGYTAALQRIEALTSELDPDRLFFVARNASRNKLKP